MYSNIEYSYQSEGKIINQNSQSWAVTTVPGAGKGKIEANFILSEGIVRTAEIAFRLWRSGDASALTPWYYTGCQLTDTPSGNDAFYIKWFEDFNEGDSFYIEATCNVLDPDGAFMRVEMICSLQTRRGLSSIAQNSTDITTLTGSLSSTPETIFSKTLTAGKYKVNYLLSGAFYVSGVVGRIFIEGENGSTLYLARESFESSVNEYGLVSMADQYIELSTSTTLNFQAEEYSTSSTDADLRKIMAHLTIEEVT